MVLYQWIELHYASVNMALHTCNINEETNSICHVLCLHTYKARWARPCSHLSSRNWWPWYAPLRVNLAGTTHTWWWDTLCIKMYMHAKCAAAHHVHVTCTSHAGQIIHTIWAWSGCVTIRLSYASPDACYMHHATCTLHMLHVYAAIAATVMQLVL